MTTQQPLTREQAILDMQKFYDERVPMLRQALVAEQARIDKTSRNLYVVYTGTPPVWVDYEADASGTYGKGRGWGVLNVKRFEDSNLAYRLARVTTNGYGERGQVVTFAHALRMELDEMESTAPLLQIAMPN